MIIRVDGKTYGGLNEWTVDWLNGVMDKRRDDDKINRMLNELNNKWNSN